MNNYESRITQHIGAYHLGERTVVIGGFTEDSVCSNCGSDNFHVNIFVKKDDWFLDDIGIWCNECEAGVGLITEGLADKSEFKKE